MKLAQIVGVLEESAPLKWQEDYDNSGLMIGDPERDVSKALICVDVTQSVLNEAVDKKCDLIISHHPLIFKGIKKLTSGSLTERMVIQAVKNDIAVYSIHTNLDNLDRGVSWALGEKIGLRHSQVLAPRKGLLCKLVTFCPVDHADRVRQALFDAGAGCIGNYDSCSFNLTGTGSFRSGEECHPFVGETGKLHFENEVRIETIYPVHLEKEVVRVLKDTHPYEEVAYDLYPLENEYNKMGSGIIGDLENPMEDLKFLDMVKSVSGSIVLRHSALQGQKVSKIAVCGGSGSFLIREAIARKADVFLTADLKYHDFFEADKRILLVDIGHYESEQFVKELIASILVKKMPTFAVLITENNTNPVHYH
ncbi:MAG: Nif3-like dinuclear metal center hexameric protein [Bacteroidales bacterium]|nr:Nif3-like dinuclear metal center hexameric protein [Lentimicrobiaceae bacterium]MDD5694535.1 Nif3-like dinuclear metal center hexameric protein [Bacteroidales bacterium]